MHVSFHAKPATPKVGVALCDTWFTVPTQYLVASYSDSHCDGTIMSRVTPNGPQKLITLHPKQLQLSYIVKPLTAVGLNTCTLVVNGGFRTYPQHLYWC